MLVRRPHGPVAELLAFCDAHPATPFARPLRERILTRLCSPEGILDLRDPRTDERVACACVLDRLVTPPDIVAAEILAWRQPSLGAAIVPQLIAAAATCAAAAGRTVVRLNWPTRVPRDVAAALTAGRLRPEDVAYQMALSPLVVPPAPALPPGWSFRDVDAARVPVLRSLTLAAFVDSPAFLPTDAEFGRGLLASPVPARLLYDADTPIGFVRVHVDGADGEVGQIGRIPSYRGRGTGPVLMHEGLRQLAAAGATRATLEVTTVDNREALALYLRHGFRVTGETESWRLAL